MGFEIVVKVMINTSYEVFQYILQIVIKMIMPQKLMYDKESNNGRNV